MVCFTCSHCGESLKKNKVEGHYSTKCSRNPIFITCVDCCKDFNEKTYSAHTKCISEKEKYSAKGFVTKPDSNKRLLKQQMWTEAVKYVAKNCVNDLKNEQFILNSILKYENIPVKKVKFQNFLSNVYKSQVDPEIVESMHSKITKEFTKMSADGKENGEIKKNGSEEKKSKKDKSNVSFKEVNEDVTEIKKRKNKDKRKLTTNINENEEANDTKLEKNNESKVGNVEVEKLNKKKKKEKRKREKYEEELKNIENHQNITVNECDEEPKIKKKKFKGNKIENETGVPLKDNSTSENNQIGETKSKKKQKRMKEVEKEDNGKGEGLDMKKLKKDVENNIEEDSTNKTKFNWQETIITILKSREDKALSLKKLRKKIVAEFESSCGGTAEKALAKFNKKINHTPGVIVHKEIARLALTDQ